MVIVGAGGHALEILDILSKRYPSASLVFFDNVAASKSVLHGLYDFLNSEEDLKKHFSTDPAFVLAVGSPSARRKLSTLCRENGGFLTSVISDIASIGDFNVMLAEGLNIMHHAIITGDVQIGEGTLINAAATVHHNVRIGEYCEISPGARLLGGAITGDECRIGANAVVMPDVKLGNRVIVGAGAVVTRDVADGITVVGVPAKPVIQS